MQLYAFHVATAAGAFIGIVMGQSNGQALANATEAWGAGADYTALDAMELWKATKDGMPVATWSKQA